MIRKILDWIEDIVLGWTLRPCHCDNGWTDGYPCEDCMGTGKR